MCASNQRQLYITVRLLEKSFFPLTDDISMRTSRRILRCMGFFCKKNESNAIAVASFIIDQLEGRCIISVASKLDTLSPKVHNDLRFTKKRETITL